MADGNLTTIEQTQPVAVSGSSALIDVIQAAVANPDVDVDKIDRLLAMQERIWDRDARVAFDQAFVTMQPHLPRIEKSRKGQNSSYAPWEDIQDKILPVCQNHGFALSFKTRMDANIVTVIAVLKHASGHSEETEFTLPADKSGSMNSVQGIGSSVSYGKRYAATALLNLRVVGQDNDGAGDTIGPDQMTELDDLIRRSGADRQGFFQYMKVEGMADITTKQFPSAKAVLLKKLKQAESKEQNND